MAAVAALTELLPAVQLDVPGCNDNLCILALREAYCEFCRRSEAYAVKTTLTGDGSTVLFTLPMTPYPVGSCFVIRVLLVTINGVDQDGTYGKTVYPNQITFETAPALAASVVVRYALVPFRITADSVSDGATPTPTLVPTIDFKFLNRWQDGIVAKAKAYLMMLPKRPWSDPQRAQLCMQQFIASIGTARTEILREGRTVDLVMTPPDIFV